MRNDLGNVNDVMNDLVDRWTILDLFLSPDVEDYSSTPSRVILQKE